MDKNVWYWAHMALGDSVLALSALNNLNSQITIKTSTECAPLINSLISVFNLANFQIEIVPDQEIDYVAKLDSNKRQWGWDVINSQRSNHNLFYYTPETISAYGQQFKTGKSNRPCVAISMNNGRAFLSYRQKQIDRLPYNKYYPHEFWKEVFGLVAKCEYDVMIIDNLAITIEEKSFLLNEFCMALIGYEGGLCHVAHTLKIPTFILPWPNKLLGEDNIMSEIYSMHFDKRTWFLESGNELLNWSIDEFKQKILDLNDSKGNHPLF